jgi:DNA-binding response OmpR family regulator
VATILILDDDLGFSFWLGHTLNTSNCDALPAKSVAEATALIGHFKLKVDFLILNPTVPGAADFIRALRREQKHLRVATLDSGDPEHPAWTGGLTNIANPH